LRKKLGVALDLGTTTVQGKLIDLDTKSELAYFSSLNEQLSHGHDIISRIKLCLEKPKGFERLHKNIISSVNFHIKTLLSIAGRKPADISLIAAVGNAALYHFTLFLSPAELVTPPYEPKYKDFVKLSAKDIGIEAGVECEFNFLPNIAGFVGSDAIAVAMAADIDRTESDLLAADLGTNGEIILGSKDKIFVTSTAAGPVFEGWHISCGMRALDGAIESVEDKNGKLELKVIGGGAPKGISGSGLVDIVAILLDRGHIDKTGRMEKDFVLCEGERRIYLSQKDIRQVQLAKAAFLSGINSLRRFSKKKPKRLLITGNFGSHLNRDSVKKAGIVPKDIMPRDIEFLENGALKGAELFIKDTESATSRVNDILKKTEHVALSQNTDFQSEYAQAMRF